MNDHERVLKVAAEWLDRGEKICLATIIRKQGSGPREVGAKMVITSGGRTAGSIGGGAVEKQIIERARRIIEEGKPVVVDFDLSGHSSDLDAMCGGGISVFMEVLGEARRLIVIGAGHVGKAVAKLAREVGFSTTLVDDRAEFLEDDGLGHSVTKVIASPEDWKERLVVDSSSFVVISSRGHSLDKEWLGEILKVGPRYVGMLGSMRKAQAIFDQLMAEGLSAEALGQVHTPVGMDIKAVTPEEIAVSIVGQLILEWRKQE
jgi:xanthine dehydrogenase accessory factor